MRKVGIALLLLAFAWLAVEQVGLLLRGARPGLRAAYEVLDSRPAKQYSKEEVVKLIALSASAQSDACPTFVLPGLAMLIGGLMGAMSGRRGGNQGDA